MVREQDRSIITERFVYELAFLVADRRTRPLRQKRTVVVEHRSVHMCTDQRFTEQRQGRAVGRMRVDEAGKDAETHFRLLQQQTRTGGHDLSLLEVEPVTGRTHQIRVHLQANETPVWGDVLYGPEAKNPPRQPEMGLRAIQLSYFNPFDRKPVEIRAPIREFVRSYGFTLNDAEVAQLTRPRLLDGEPKQRREKVP